MPAESGNVPIDGFWSHLKVTGDLSVCHSTNGLHEDQGIEFGQFLPVGGAEGLATEGSFAVHACKPLDTTWELISIEESASLEFPPGG